VPYSWYGCFGEEKNILVLPEMELLFLGHPATSVVTIGTTNYGLTILCIADSWNELIGTEKPKAL